MESEKVAAQTQAVLKSTGKAAGVTAKQVDKLATTISNYSGIDDEAIQAGENMLLTFTNIRNGTKKTDKIFDRATETIADMSTALGQDMKTSAIQLGKALNDPIKGVSALRRVGVTFTDKQKELIEQLVKTGKTAEAQKVILAELRKEFGGSAKAAGDTFGGSLNKLRNSFDNLAGLVVGAAAPAIQKYVDQINNWLSKAENQERVQKAVKDGINAITGAVKAVKGAFDKFWPILENVVDKMGGWKTILFAIAGLKLASKLDAFTGSLGRMNPKMGTAAKNTKAFGGGLRGLQNIGAITIPIAIAGSMKGDSFAIKVLKALGVGATAALITGSLPIGLGVAVSTAAYGVFSGPAGKTRQERDPNRGGMGANTIPRKPPKRAPSGPQGPTGGGPRGPTTGYSAASTFTPTARAVNITGPVTVVANNPRQLVAALQQTAGRGSASRSGPYGGSRLAFEV